jgi:ABC-type branched-subunit amino acid transport system ATPase component
MSPEQAALETHGVRVCYGGVVANDDVSLAVPHGRIIGLIGPNGAGKTTFVDAVTGFASATGEILLGGRAIEGLAPHRRARLGLSRTWQSLELFDDLSVGENVLVAERPVRLASMLADLVWPDRHRSTGATEEALALLGLHAAARQSVRELSLGQRKLLGIARALATRPEVVVLDEPAAGLDSRESRELVPRLRAVVDAGVSMLLIDHDMGLIFEACDEVYVMKLGRVMAHGAPDEIRHDRAVIAAYLGEEGRSEQV